MDNPRISFIPLGGIGDVTRNMYLYEYHDQILIVDCGIGFADETMLGVDLLLPDITYLLKTCMPVGKSRKKIIGMLLSHGHEDHIGALPFLLPQLPDFPIYATPLTAALTNEKLKEYGVNKVVQSVPFESPKEIILGDFSVSFIRVTHSIPDSSNIFIKTPVGNFYHGSDFKIDLTPADGKRTDYQKIVRLASQGVLCLLSDCLGAEREGATPSEISLTANFEREMRMCKGKFIVTTFGSNISRLNQGIEVARKFNRRVCFVGRSLVRAKELAVRLGYMELHDGEEIQLDELKNFRDEDMMLFVAGSQGQDNSAMSRIANGDHRDIKLSPLDTVVFSADPIPGNETSVNSLIDLLSKGGVRVVYSSHTGAFHVSGHGSAHDLMLMMSMVKGRTLLPIGGAFKQMVAYKNLAKRLSYEDKDIFLIEDGQEIIFTRRGEPKMGRKIKIQNVYVDQMSGEEIEGFVLRDRQKLSTDGVVIVITEVDSTGKMIKSEVTIRGFVQKEALQVQRALYKLLKEKKYADASGNLSNMSYIRRRIADMAEKQIYTMLRRRPLILPIVIEV